MDTFEELFDIFKPSEPSKETNDDDLLFAEIGGTAADQNLSADVSESRTIENSLQNLRHKLTIINE